MSADDSNPAPADLILVARRIHTMVDGEAEVEFVAIKDRVVLGTGTRSSLAQFAGAETRIVDVGDRTVLPGFVDVHAHGEVAARTLATTVDCRAPRCGSVAAVLETLRQNLPSASHGWLVGQGNLFLDQKLADRRLPTREELDRVSTDVAIALRAGGHVTVLNSKALELAGITRDYRPPDHSITGKPIVERDPATGEPIGIVKEMDNALPFPEMNGQALREALANGMRDLFTRHGVTSLGEISETLEGIRCMDELSSSGDLGLRVYVYLWVPGTVSLADACAGKSLFPPRSPESLVRVQGVKLFADGGYSAASAAVKREYVGQPGWRGALALTPEQVAEALARTRDEGLQLAIHANGDRAQEEVCNALAAAGGSPGGRIRTRIEHAGNFLPEPAVTVESWRRAGIIPVPQPVFIYTFGGYFPTYLGSYGETGRFPFRSLLEDGWRLSGSSDVWVGSEERATNPFFSVWCCVRRETFAGEVIDEAEQITVGEALRMHTIDAAAVLGESDRIGSLAAGKAADCVVVDRDPLTCATDQLLEVQVDAVFLGGRLVHERDGAAKLGSVPY